MSTHFVGEGNIGSAPDYREFPNGNDEPRRLLRLNVYFDNPIPKKDGEFEDRVANIVRTASVSAHPAALAAE